MDLDSIFLYTARLLPFLLNFIIIPGIERKLLGNADLPDRIMPCVPIDLLLPLQCRFQLACPLQPTLVQSSTAYTVNVLVHNHHIISILKSLSSLPSSACSLNSHYLSPCLTQLLSLLSGSTTNFIKAHSLHLSLTAAFSIFNLIPMQRRPKS